MDTTHNLPAHPPFDATPPIVPAGCISAIPRQSVQSCEMVITTLAAELDHVRHLLGNAIEHHIYYKCQDEVQRREDPFFVGLDSATELLADLRRDWPHLDI